MDAREVVEKIAANRLWLEEQAAAGDPEAAALVAAWPLLPLGKQLAARGRIEMRQAGQPVRSSGHITRGG
ncbi:MAG: hypothetical protein KGK07_17690 [Chloroflexota bacterium]|nr:hypothetical protein [Chloroflexota bacterium]